MTIIFQHGGIFWIEYIETIVTTVADNTQADSVVINLVRPGRYVGGTGFLRTGAALRPSMLMRNQSGGILNYADAITGVLARLEIETGSPAVVNVGMFVFMRK